MATVSFLLVSAVENNKFKDLDLAHYTFLFLHGKEILTISRTIPTVHTKPLLSTVQTATYAPVAALSLNYLEISADELVR